MAQKYAFLIDLRRCVGCTSCQVSCKMENAVPLGYFRSRVDITDLGDYPKAKRLFFPKMCNHCDEPPCITDCPADGAIHKRSDGLVVVDRSKCIACGNCVENCPYGACFLHPHVEAADKCDGCLHLLEAGIETPTCARNCAGMALCFGDINDASSKIAQLLADHKTATWAPEYGTKPNLYFIAPDTDMFTAADGSINR